MASSKSRKVSDPRHRSRVILEGPDRAPARAMMKAIGFSDEDLARPQIGVAHCWIETMPCNWNHSKLAEKVKEGVRAAGGTPIEVNTVAITDGITMGTEGMKASLISREVVADSVELVARGHMFDGLVTISGCDKTIPAMSMVLGRLDIPGLMLYGGSIMFGRCAGDWPTFGRDRKLTIQDVFEALGAYNAGKISEAEFRDVEDHACPGAGACGGQFTANTMATAYEMLGISPMGFNDVPALDPGKEDIAFECGKRVMELLREGVTPRSIITRRSFENAIAGVMATGGSTNAVLHLLATARDFGVTLALADFDRMSRRTPVLANLKPWGRYTAPEMYQAGGMARGRQAPGGGAARPCRREDGDRAHHRRGDRRRARTRRPACHHLAGGRPEEGRRHRHPAGQPRPGRLRDQALRAVAREPSRAGPRVRTRRGRLPGGEAGADQAERRDRDPQRGPEGRARHARDAPRDRGPAGGGTRRERGPDDRRPILGGHPWLHDRPHRAGGGRRRPNRRPQDRRRDLHRREEAPPRRGAFGGRDQAAAGRGGERPGLATRAASFTSTWRAWAAPRRARSPADPPFARCPCPARGGGVESPSLAHRSRPGRAPSSLSPPSGESAGCDRLTLDAGRIPCAARRRPLARRRPPRGGRRPARGRSGHCWGLRATMDA